MFTDINVMNINIKLLKTNQCINVESLLGYFLIMLCYSYDDIITDSAINLLAVQKKIIIKTLKWSNENFQGMFIFLKSFMELLFPKLVISCN